VARLVGDQLQQHELQLARVEDAPASAAMLAVAAAMAEVTTAASTVVARCLESLGFVRSGMSAPSAKAAALVAVIAAPMAPALFVAVGGVGETHVCQSFMF